MELFLCDCVVVCVFTTKVVALVLKVMLVFSVFNTK